MSYPTKEIRDRLTDDYMRGFRAAATGHDPEVPAISPPGAFGRGYAFGVIAGGQAMIKAGLHAATVIDSPAMVQAQRNAAGRGP